jgi:hypothetical protein
VRREVESAREEPGVDGRLLAEPERSPHPSVERRLEASRLVVVEHLDGNVVRVQLVGAPRQRASGEVVEGHLQRPPPRYATDIPAILSSSSAERPVAEERRHAQLMERTRLLGLHAG